MRMTDSGYRGNAVLTSATSVLAFSLFSRASATQICWRTSFSPCVFFFCFRFLSFLCWAAMAALRVRDLPDRASQRCLAEAPRSRNGDDFLNLAVHAGHVRTSFIIIIIIIIIINITVSGILLATQPQSALGIADLPSSCLRHSSTFRLVAPTSSHRHPAWTKSPHLEAPGAQSTTPAARTPSTACSSPTATLTVPGKEPSA